MKICLVDDKLTGHNGQSVIKDNLLKSYPKNFEFNDVFFPFCFGTGENNGVALESEILSVLDQYNAIIYHASSFGEAIVFRDIIKQAGKSSELIGFTGSVYDTTDFHPQFNHIILERDTLYDRLESFVKDAVDKNILNLNLILED